MKTLVIIRHAKSSWANPMQSDFDRELNERGREDAPAMGKRLKQLGVVPDIIIASSAKRTRQTANRIAKEVGYDIDNIQWEEKLYHCVPAVMEEVIRDMESKYQTAFIVAHNPGITEFANELSPSFKIDNMPTCGAVGAHFEAEEWNEFSIAEKTIFLFEYPKKEHDTN